MSMEIEGLSPRQQEIADQLWSLESPEQISEFLSLLPRSLLHDAYVVHQMMMWACRDSFEPDDFEAANHLITKISQQTR